MKDIILKLEKPFDSFLSSAIKALDILSMMLATTGYI